MSIKVRDGTWSNRQSRHAPPFVFVTSEGVKGLRELAERARDAEDFKIFEKHFLSQDLSGEFSSFVRYIDTNREDAWAALRRSEFRSLDEGTLTETVHSILDKLVVGPPKDVYSILATFAQERVHKRITSKELWDELATKEIRPNDFAADTSLALKLQGQLDDYLSSQAFDIAGYQVERHEAGKVVDALCHENGLSQVVFVTGKAGVGKTGVAAQVARELMSHDWLVLPFRMDRLDPTQRVEEVGRQLLAREKSPVALLAGMANGRSCLLIIEQLDAVSTTSGRHPEFFECAAKMIRESLAHPNMRVLLGCRAFDLENDQRFRELKMSLKERMSNISVAEFKPDQVDHVLSHLGISPGDLSQKQRELLRLPLHLRLFADVVGTNERRPLSFVTEKDLFDEFWMYINSTVKPLLSDQNAFASILEKLCEEMNHRRSLSVPAGVIRQWDSDADRLVSANLLVHQEGRVAFFHEGFFDYVFARFFIENGERLVDYLLRSHQDLFLRAQVRQVLVFLRDQNPEAYLQELHDLLSSSAIRFHIKKLALSIVGQVGNPTAEEWELLERCLSREELGITRAVYSAVWPSTEWFEFLAKKGILAGWLEGEKETARTFAFNYVRRSAEKAPEISAQLLSDLAGKDEDTDKRLAGDLIGTSRESLHPDLESLFYRIADNTERDWVFRARYYEHALDRIAYQDAKAGCRMLGRYLEQLLELSEDDHPFLKGLQEFKIPDNDITKLAEDEPVAFVDAAFAPILANMEKFAVREGRPPYQELIWYSELVEKEHYGVSNLFWNLVQALLKSAQLSPGSYHRAVESLMESETRWAHQVLLRILRGDAISEKASRYLLMHWKHSGIWYDRFGLWDAHDLLRDIGSNIAENELKEIETLVLQHYEEWNPQNYWSDDKRRNARWYLRSRGQRQFTLLKALPENRLSATGRRRLSELRRKAGAVEWERKRPLRTGGGVVRSPLSSDVTAKMNDAQWLSAIQRYATHEERERLENSVIGGARELSMMLEARTGEEPVRFAELMLRFPEDTTHDYFDAVVMGLRQGGLPIHLLERVVAKTKNSCSDEAGRWIVETIAAHCEMSLPTRCSSRICH